MWTEGPSLGRSRSLPFLHLRRVDRLGLPAERVAAAVTALAALAALATALLFPATYVLGARDRASGLALARAEIFADAVSTAASGDPDLWNAMLGSGDGNFAGLPIASPDDADLAKRAPEERRVFAVDGRVLLDVSPAHRLRRPHISVRAPILLAGNRIGTAEITQSFFAESRATLLIGVGSAVFGLLLLFLLRVVPLRLMRQALDRASFLAGHDALTGLPNRAVLIRRLEQALDVTGRLPKQSVAVLYLDLDRFKQINDTLGHPAGDAVLHAFAQRFRARLRDGATLARLGGDEFAIVQLGTCRPTAERLAADLLDSAADPVSVDGQELFVGLSVGIAFSAPGDNGVEVMKKADLALYSAKGAGRGNFRIFSDDMNDMLRARRQMETDLRAAFGSGDLTVHYQPQIDLVSGEIVGAEALMRWYRPDGPVRPDVFIPLAEEIGLIGSMTTWLLQVACREAAMWPNTIRLAVNISPVHLRGRGFLGDIRDALDGAGLAANRLEVEVTEGILLEDTEENLAILAGLRRMGVRLVMDDFGTGYASLAYLKRFRFDKVKIDRTFIRDLGTDPAAAAIVHAVVEMSRALGMSSNAEGVERPEQVELLRAHGCDEVQGFYYSPAVPAERFRVLTRPLEAA